jgi:hypothetical protein
MGSRQPGWRPGSQAHRRRGDVRNRGPGPGLRRRIRARRGIPQTRACRARPWAGRGTLRGLLRRNGQPSGPPRPRSDTVHTAGLKDGPRPDRHRLPLPAARPPHPKGLRRSRGGLRRPANPNCCRAAAGSFADDAIAAIGAPRQGRPAATTGLWPRPLLGTPATCQALVPHAPIARCGRPPPARRRAQNDAARDRQICIDAGSFLAPG